jgi:hypothetical protein
MGLTQRLGTIPLAIQTDTSNNVGIGGAANASFKLQVTGTTNLTGALSGTSATFSSSVTAGAFIKSSVTSGGSVITAQSTATSGEAQLELIGKNSSGTIRSGTFKYDNSDVLRIGTSSNIALRFETNDIVRLTISNAGAATFNGSDASGWFGGFSNSGTNFAYIGATAQFANSGGTSTDFGIRSANAMAFYTSGGSERMRILSTGQIGIGTITVDSAISVDIQNASPSSSNVFLRLKNNAASEDTGIKIVGTFGTPYEHTFGVNTLTNTGDLIFHNSNSLGYRWYVDGNERLKITSIGQLNVTANGVGANIGVFYNSATSQPYGINVTYTGASPNTSSNDFLYLADASQSKLIIYSNGNVVNRNTSYGTLSDIKLKENIVDTTPKLDDLLKVKVRNYNLIADPNLKQIGFIAQELEEVFPSLVEEHKDLDENKNDLGTTTKSIKTTVLIPILVKAIQELTQKVNALENK